ncbi:hypothetical protein ACIGW8_32620 [Streptomyces sioyaensis]|uniref:hypothetical protein n=1 Tax=Streptomyces sioyaensis TaxID=67364 RepID=UPI0037D2A61A
MSFGVPTDPTLEDIPEQLTQARRDAKASLGPHLLHIFIAVAQNQPDTPFCGKIVATSDLTEAVAALRECITIVRNLEAQLMEPGPGNMPGKPPNSVIEVGAAEIQDVDDCGECRVRVPDVTIMETGGDLEFEPDAGNIRISIPSVELSVAHQEVDIRTIPPLVITADGGIATVGVAGKLEKIEIPAHPEGGVLDDNDDPS